MLEMGRRCRLAAALALLWLLALTSIAASPAAGAGVAGKSVAGGYYASEGQAPWTTALVLGSPGPLEDHRNQRCGGSLISAKRVLTAAHCVVTSYDRRAALPAGRFRALVGLRSFPPAASQRRGITGIAIHPRAAVPPEGLSDPAPEYDLAVLFLDRPVRNIKPAEIGTDSDWAQDGTALGWGRITYHAEAPLNDPALKAIDLRLVSASKCALWLDPSGSRPHLRTTQFCGYDEEGDDCITHGDSGGPLVVDGPGGRKLIGVTSFFADGVSWVPCLFGNLVGFSWVAGPELRSWPLGVRNPACPGARARLKKARALAQDRRDRPKKLRRAKRRVKLVCTG